MEAIKVLPLAYNLYLVAFSCLPKTSISLPVYQDLEEDIDDLIIAKLGPDPFKRPLEIEHFREEFTTEQPIFENVKPEDEMKENEPPLNASIILMNLLKQQISCIIRRNDDTLSNFKNNVDEFEEIHKMFDKIKLPAPSGRRSSGSPLSPIPNPSDNFFQTMLNDTGTAFKNILRINDIPFNFSVFHDPDRGKYQSHIGHKAYDYREYATLENLIVTLHKFSGLIYHFVYRTRHNMEYSQLLRRRYFKHIRYKMGFCFALLRNLLKEQKLLINAFNFSYLKITEFVGNRNAQFLYTIEKVLNLERDMRDVIQHIKELEYNRKMIEDPDYYVFVPSSTGRYSG